MSRRLARAAALAALVSAATACAARRTVFTPAELRAEVARRAPELPPGDVVVPFDVGPEARARLAELMVGLNDADSKVRAILQAMFDPKVFGLRYASRVTGDAAETLASREGNCLALASVFVGLARQAGLDAHYMDASMRVHETLHADDGLTVTSGHITAMVATAGGNTGLDFARLGPIVGYRQLDDVEALAHFYNNRGFERLDEARARGATPDWEEVGRDFRRSVEVMPSFARGWNNLGMVAAEAGRDAEAAAYYREAIRRDPKLAAPRNNLGALLLRQGDARAALEVLEPAVRLSSSGPHVLYNLALARLASGDRDGALDALRRAAGEGYPRAQRLIDELAVAAK